VPVEAVESGAWLFVGSEMKVLLLTTTPGKLDCRDDTTFTSALCSMYEEKVA